MHLTTKLESNDLRFGFKSLNISNAESFVQFCSEAKFGCSSGVPFRAGRLTTVNFWMFDKKCASENLLENTWGIAVKPLIVSCSIWHHVMCKWSKSDFELPAAVFRFERVQKPHHRFFGSIFISVFISKPNHPLQSIKWRVKNQFFFR